MNVDLYLKSGEEDSAWGSHVYFYSIEHASGKGPQLVIEGTPGPPKTAPKKKPCTKRRHLFPPKDAALDR